MNKKATVLWMLVLIAVLASVTHAGDWTGKKAIGFRGGVWIPWDTSVAAEPYRMGVDVGLAFKYGLSRSFVLDLSAAYLKTYDDTSATDDAQLKFMNKDLASQKLTALMFGLTGNFYFLPSKKIQPFVLAGVGVDMWKVEPEPSSGSGVDTKMTDFGGKVGAGVNFWLSDNVTLDVQGKLTYLLANLSADDDSGAYSSELEDRPFLGYIQPSIGLTYLFGKAKDTDGDGVSDKKDRCPETPMGAIVDATGCPLDDDKDGVFNGLDRCVNTPVGAIVDEGGCPRDTDKDGVLDGIDKCSDTPPGAVVDATGCPTDTDGDGVYDGLDKCADTPSGCKVGADGCTLDGDGDGVCDGIDRCPSTAPGTQIDANGCPVDVKPPVQKITLNIKYKSGSFEPDDNAKQILDELIKTMKAYTGTVIEIHGFTDDVGKDSSNQVLSEKRAGAVRDYLLAGGVEAERMTTRGFGEDPKYFVGDNKTAEGRQQNRRVEILSVEK